MSQSTKETGKITGEDVAALLHHIHHHGEREGQILYYEKDLLPVLKALGLPEPVWKHSMSIAEWKKFKKDGNNQKTNR